MCVFKYYLFGHVTILEFLILVSLTSVSRTLVSIFLIKKYGINVHHFEDNNPQIRHVKKLIMKKQFADKAIIFLNFREPGNVFHGETKQ